MIGKRFYISLVFMLSLTGGPAFAFHGGGGATVDLNDVSVNFFGDIEVLYTDNVFHLSESKKDMVDEADPDDVESGRLKDMESIADTIISPRIGMEFKSRGFFDRKSLFSLWGQYHAYTKNTELSTPELGLKVKHNIADNAALTMEWSYLDHFFKKNYLSDVDDANGNGNITKAERIYSQAFYDEYQGILTYSQTVYEEENGTVSKVIIEPFGGIRYRNYEAAFDNRDQDIALGGIKVRIGFSDRLKLKLCYTFEKVDSPNGQELVLIDETLDGIDVNADGQVRENAALITRIDRSCNRHTFEIKPEYNLSRHSTLFVGYEWRWADFSSGNPLDVDHYDQTAGRSRIRAGINCELNKQWSTELEYRYTDDDAEDDDDYTENAVKLTLNCEWD